MTDAHLLHTFTIESSCLDVFSGKGFFNADVKPHLVLDNGSVRPVMRTDDGKRVGILNNITFKRVEPCQKVLKGEFTFIYGDTDQIPFSYNVYQVPFIMLKDEPVYHVTLMVDEGVCDSMIKFIQSIRAINALKRESTYMKDPIRIFWETQNGRK